MRKRGFTLIEVAIAIALFAIVTVWSINVLINMSKGSSTTEDLTIATLLASQKIEELKSYSYDELNNTQNVTTPTDFPSPYNNYQYTLNITKDEQNDYAKFKVIFSVYKKNNPTPLITIDANYIRRISDGKNIGL